MRYFRTAQARIFFDARTAKQGLHYHAGAGKQFTGLFALLPVRIRLIFVKIELYELFAEYRSLWGE